MSSHPDHAPQRRRPAISRHRSPLRYPGGKAALAPFLKKLISINGLRDGLYIEPYAGGAGIAIELLATSYVSSIHINDIDRGVHAFWHALLNQTDALIKLIKETPVTLESRIAAKHVHATDKDPKSLSLGFATFFLNRVNRSGVILGGVIGGLKQQGADLIDARYNKEELIRRISFIARYRNSIKLTNLDALTLLNDLESSLQNRPHLLYLDPPYFHKGSKLYTSYYRPLDHAKIATKLGSMKEISWMVSYDGCSEIEELFQGFTRLDYNLAYTANGSSSGRELMFFSPDLRVPNLDESRRINPLNKVEQLSLALKPDGAPLILTED